MNKSGILRSLILNVSGFIKRFLSQKMFSVFPIKTQNNKTFIKFRS